jgi:hypothetical protein
MEFQIFSKLRMKAPNITAQVLLFALLSANAGCRQPAVPNQLNGAANKHTEKPSTYALFAPSKIDIMPLTEFVRLGDAQKAKIVVYVSLLDQFGSQIKTPAMFRFELYEHVTRSAQPKGKRAVIWPDIDLTDPAANNDYWRDFLRAYEFTLPCEVAESQDYIMQLTCLCPNGKRLSSEYTLKQIK